MRKIQRYTLAIMLLSLPVMTSLAQDSTVAPPVAGNTRGIMLLILLSGLGLIALTGFIISVLENYEEHDES